MCARQAGITQRQITPAMIEAGVRALHDAIGYNYNGDGEFAVELIFRRMEQTSE